MKNKHTVDIHTDFIKLDALLKFASIAETGGHAKNIILEGEVSVNGQTCLQRGKKLYPGDIVTLGDLQITVNKQQ